MDFPRVSAAIEARRAARVTVSKLPAMPPSIREDRDGYWRWKKAQDVYAETHEKALGAYAEEMLPAILGDTWKRAGRSMRAAPRGSRRAQWVIESYYTLFDHGQAFRRTKGAGQLVWSNAAIIGQPYPRSEDAMEECAAQLCADHPVTIWRRDDLSDWAPGWTSLILVAENYHLKPENAVAFGFRPMGLAHAQTTA